MKEKQTYQENGKPNKNFIQVMKGAKPKVLDYFAILCTEMALIITEVKAGGNVEEIVDKYVNCKTPELRQQVISGIRQMVGNHMLDNVKIGY